MVKRISDKGGIYHEPPYTEDEIADMYRRYTHGPMTIVRRHPQSAVSAEKHQQRQEEKPSQP